MEVVEKCVTDVDRMGIVVWICEREEALAHAPPSFLGFEKRGGVRGRGWERIEHTQQLRQTISVCGG